MHDTLLILAGGASSRMKKSAAIEGLSEEEIQAANTRSKALMGYGKDNRPILDFLLRNAEKAGYKNIYLIVGGASQDFKQYYGNSTSRNTFHGLDIWYATQHIPEGRNKPFGTADAVFQALEQYPKLQGQTFTVCNCDNLYSVEVLKALASTPASHAFIAYDRDELKFSSERIARFALVQLDDNNYIGNIIEKPSEVQMEEYKDKDGKLRVSMNIFKFSGRQMYPYLKACPPHPERNEKELPSAILNFCKDHPGQFLGIPFHEHVPDLTSKEDIKTFKSYLDSLHS
ncbi:MAG: sugar phosphate nucleotidyltransferase [Bacteroidota bacterium]